MKRLNEHIKSSVSIYEDFLNLCPTIDGVQLAENIMKLHHRSLRPCLLYNNQHCWAGLLHSITLTIKTSGCLKSCWFWDNWEAHLQSPTRLLWGDIGISSAHYRVPNASIHQWPSIGCLLLCLKTTLRLLWVRFLQSFMKWEPNNGHKTLCGGISCMLLIKPSNRINHYNT